MSDSPCPKCTLRPGQTCSNPYCPGLAADKLLRREVIEQDWRRVRHQQPMGCICPPTSEQTCMNPLCARKNHMKGTNCAP